MGDRITQPEEAAREEYITVRIPVKAPRLRLVGADAAAVLYQLNRNDLIAIGVECLRKAAEWATEELTDIMGDVDVTEFVQKFMDRKTTSVLQEGEACCDPTHEQASKKERQSQGETTNSGAHSEVRAS